jgi:ketosteroid isomerase-like protein
MSIPTRLLARLSLAVLLLGVAAPIAVGQGIKRPSTPLRTARDELKEFREAYAAAYNKKDTVSVGDMYGPNAVVIDGDGSVLVGNEAIRAAVGRNAPKWTHITITSDTLRIVGNTAWDVGTSRAEGSSGGGEQVSHYLAVLRRGTKSWKLDRLAIVPEGRGPNAADSTAR